MVPTNHCAFFSLDDGVKASLFNGTIARQVKGPTFSDWRMMPNWVLSYNPGFVYVLLVCLLACFLINEICLTKFWKREYVFCFWRNMFSSHPSRLYNPTERHPCWSREVYPGMEPKHPRLVTGVSPQNPHKISSKTKESSVSVWKAAPF